MTKAEAEAAWADRFEHQQNKTLCAERFIVMVLPGGGRDGEDDVQLVNAAMFMQGKGEQLEAAGWVAT